MQVELLTSTSSLAEMERNAALGALTCRGNACKEHVPSEVLMRIIQAGHESVLEHINLTYRVKGLSRACLQELARHRHISLSVESTRHTLIPKLQEAIDTCTYPDTVYWKDGYPFVQALYSLWRNSRMSNDELKYYMPEFWPTNLVLTSNIRELRYILKLRTAPSALGEFRYLAHALYEAVPEQFKYLLTDCVHEEASNE